LDGALSFRLIDANVVISIIAVPSVEALLAGIAAGNDGTISIYLVGISV
jgi:hypothetical protein